MVDLRWTERVSFSDFMPTMIHAFLVAAREASPPTTRHNGAVSVLGRRADHRAAGSKGAWLEPSALNLARAFPEGLPIVILPAFRKMIVFTLGKSDVIEHKTCSLLAGFQLESHDGINARRPRFGTP